MGDLPKGILILVIAVAIGSQAMKALDIQYLSQSPNTSAVKVASTKLSDQMPSSRKEDQSLSVVTEADLQSILAGADPTDVLAPTAAGKKLTVGCESGFIAGDLDENKFSKISYASLDIGDLTYIQVSRFSPSYLVQERYQTVSARQIDEIPNAVKQHLNQLINDPALCEEQDLYLSKIDYLQ